MKDKNDNGKFQSGRNKYDYPEAAGYGLKGCRCWKCKPARENKRVNIDTEKKPVKVDAVKTLESSLSWQSAGVVSEALDLLVKKHNDYGPRSISASPGGALNGLLVRLHDKIERAANINGKPVDKINNETLRDTFLDILNYATIAVLVLDKKWDKLK